MPFLVEFRRRKVIQVAAVYAVVAWLIIQVVDVVSVPLSLPTWFATVTIVFLGIGFPIALILAWIIDRTPQGMVVDQGAPARRNGGTRFEPANQFRPARTRAARRRLSGRRSISAEASLGNW